MSSSQLVRLEDKPEGGYDYELVSDLPSDGYTCLICNLLAREAQQASCCGKIFCKQCLEKSARADENCPECCDSLKGKYFPDRRVSQEIDQLNVYCKNREDGCKWEGELSHAKSHHDRCPHRHVECPKRCAEAVRNMDLPLHLEKQCPNRKVECDYCEQVGKHAYISTDHLEYCPGLQIDCPNQDCQEKPERRNLGTHRQECPKEKIRCQYAKLGCKHVCLREAMADHNEKEVQGHLQLAINELAIHRTLLESRTGAPKGHVFKLANFTKLKENGEEWWSPPFYTFPGGYKMCLIVYAGGNGDGEGTHVSGYLHLMEGENDKTLEWPMRATFSIELLNQERDQNHKKHSVDFDETKPMTWNSKVSEGCAANGCGRHKLMEHHELEGESLPPHRQYLKDDTVYFRVTMTKKMSTSKPWLAGAIPS